jgi:hypothetical protein
MYASVANPTSVVRLTHVGKRPKTTSWLATASEQREKLVKPASANVRLIGPAPKTNRAYAA